jgi:hypothetical protein
MENQRGRFRMAVRGADPDIFLLMWDLTSKDKLLNTMRATMKGFELASDSGAIQFLFASRADAEASADLMRKAYHLTAEVIEDP